MSPFVLASAPYLQRRSEQLATSADLRRLTDRLRRLAAPLVEAPPEVPEGKAMLSQDGGLCARDGSPLAFDPFNRDEHHCLRCGAVYSGERHLEWWLGWYHLWLAERAVHLALLGGLRDDAAAATSAAAIVAGYADRYHGYPLRDCVLGPSRLFFSTYLESIWLVGIVGAADLLRAQGRLSESVESRTATMARDSADLIATFDEGLSNRQTWHHTALLAAGLFLDDEAAVRGAVAGLEEHLVRGVGADGMWYEGENYHFFAQRALLLGVEMARSADVDLYSATGEVAGRVAATFRAPLDTVLPDLSFPARRDAQFGASLRQPRFAETWELGYARTRDERLASFLHELYSGTEGLELEQPPESGPRDEVGWADVAEVEQHRPPRRFDRADLSWKSLLWMRPELPEVPLDLWRPGSSVLESQGLAILRRESDRSYLSIEFGDPGGVHGHADRLHVSYHAEGRAWFLDVGTGSYVRPDLEWYRSTLAHNAPLIDGRSQLQAVGSCTAFQDGGRWAWCRAEFPLGTLAPSAAVRRSLIRGPSSIFDLLEVDAEREVWVLLPWHPLVSPEATNAPVEAPPPAFGAQPFVREVRRAGRGGVTFRAEDGSWTIVVAGEPEPTIYAATAPGPPYSGDQVFLAAVARGAAVRLATAFCPDHVSLDVQRDGSGWAVRQGGSVVRHVPMGGRGWRVETGGGIVLLGGARPHSEPIRRRAPDEATPVRTSALAIGSERPTAPSFVLEAPEHYRRAEVPYPGPERFAARGWLWWTPQVLHVEVEVRKPEVVFRAPGAPDPRLDNEVPHIHSDGLQVYLGWPGAAPKGYVVIPVQASGDVEVRPVGGETAGELERGMAEVRGRWERTSEGYRVWLECVAPVTLVRGREVRFDCLVNEMWPERVRRAGQLALSGGGDWVWLAGDRPPPGRVAMLELA